MIIWRWIFGGDDDVRVEPIDSEAAARPLGPVRECRGCRWLVTLAGNDRRCDHASAKRASATWLAEGDLPRALTARQSETMCGISGKLWEVASVKR